jgi:hypothetical protein
MEPKAAAAANERQVLGDVGGRARQAARVVERRARVGQIRVRELAETPTVTPR